MDENNSAPAAEANAGITQAQLQTAVATAVASAVAEANAAADARLATERARIEALDGLAAKAGPGAATIVADAKKNGTSADATALAIIMAGAHLQGAVLTALAGDDKTATGAVPAATPAAPGAVAQTAEGWKAEWAQNAALKADFPNAESYAAFKKGESEGRVRLMRGAAAQ